GILCPGPQHSPQDRSLSVKFDVQAEAGFVVHSFANDDPILCRDHVRQRLGLAPFTKSKGNGKDQKVISATYDYVDEAGNLLFQVVRYEPKDFRQRKPDSSGGWTWKLGDVKRAPYRLPQLIEGIAANHPVFIVEGEKDALCLNKLGIIATTNAGGS